MSHPYVLAISGASGAVYAVRLLEVLLSGGHNVELTISPSAALVLKQELGLEVDLENFDLDTLLPAGRTPVGNAVSRRAGIPPRGRADDTSRNATEGVPYRGRGTGNVAYHHYQDVMAPIASGSFLTSGMVICPCSGGTLSAVVHGSSSNLLQRAADVHLKERRKLVLVPRETPLSVVQLDNMKRACEIGAVVLPAMPGWYHGVNSVQDLVDFIVARILDQLGESHELMKRWGTT